MQESTYLIDEPDSISSPGLIVFRDLVKRNIDLMVRIAGGPERLRPHCKTHKMAQVIAMQQEAGISKFKCATLAEAKMLAACGVKDIFLAYNPVGPNIDRAVDLARRHPELKLCVAADHPSPVESLAECAEAAGVQIGVLLDLNSGLNRTGIAIGEDARNLYEMIASYDKLSGGIKPAGIHWYDGQHSQPDFFERKGYVEAGWQKLISFRDQLLTHGLPVPRVVAGGTGSFPILAEHGEPKLELSPGTVLFHDAGYQQAFPEQKFTPAALVITRVVSCPNGNRLTLDAGTKSLASDPAMEKRIAFPELPDARIVLHNEEHLVVESRIADQFQPGDTMLGIPWHICPTVALYPSATVVDNGEIIDSWQITARD